MELYKALATSDLKEEFKNLCHNLFIETGMDIDMQTKSEHGIDMLIQCDAEHCAVVEIKLYRSKKVALDTIEQAVFHLKRVNDAIHGSHLILIVSTFVPDDWVQLVKSRFGITLWDQNDLIHMSKDLHPLASEFIDFFERINPPIETKKITVPNPYKRLASIHTFTETTVKPFCHKAFIGHDLYLNLVKKNNRSNSWTKFENNVFDIMKHLFGKDLSGWYKNLKMDSSHNRFEMVCRINSKHDFWNQLALDFNTRYIFFECKDYKEVFGYKNVSSDDVNVLGQALRAIGLIVTKSDDENYPDFKSQGAFYDNGKLLLHLTEFDIYRMLLDKDMGNDTTSLLKEKIDDAMIQIRL
ncbi:conserved protein of unknown function [Petrocella atlantisensis]|jgi:hypothetical protein|uniref:Restriction endonuclease type IV Mrr domain-containing protein n=1 Tax=Petrocella atlantisensis TaxID=2173034 RepID=A0A3P7P2F3_9FIRM|nr:restriction endonuclease [Petrocella atlantisensis]PKM54801.1 MAG: hypothetical protein CVV00_06785 [Firmicutes bacterium HGW-Firmicutes-5]VDN47670.1 conserved protein of unknown function [Petrocella atlantisensis]